MSIISFALIIVISFIAGIEGILDEFQFHQPLVACTLIGLVTNHLQEGLILGGFLQMMALGWANVGASVAPDVTLASVASSIFMVQGLNGSVTGEYVISASIAIAIPLSVIGLSLTKICRTKAIGLVHKMDVASETADFGKIERLQMAGICMQGLRVAIPAAILLVIPSHLYVVLFEAIPQWLLEGLSVGSGLIPALGFAIVINVLASKKTWLFFALGFVLAALPNLTTIGLAVIGISITLIYMALDKEDYSEKES